MTVMKNIMYIVPLDRKVWKSIRKEIVTSWRTPISTRSTRERERFSQLSCSNRLNTNKYDNIESLIVCFFKTESIQGSRKNVAALESSSVSCATYFKMMILVNVFQYTEKRNVAAFHYLNVTSSQRNDSHVNDQR